MALGGVAPRVVTLDALGTLVALERPVERLVAELGARGVEVDAAHAGAALRAEIAYYRAHHDEGADAASLALLRARCADVLGGALERDGARLDRALLLDALLAALRFVAFPDVPAALGRLRAAGVRLVVVSNWDVSLHEMLRATGLDALVDGAISSAEAGARKPAPQIFALALALAGADCEPEAALHVGDAPELDVAGAHAAGMRAVLVARGTIPGDAPSGAPVIRTLADLPALAGA